MRNKEAFVYLWFDTKNRMFYLGYHKGTPDDSYTHSSTVMESFAKTSIPSYMRRRILAMGTEQEMIELEKELLDNRKEKCWDKYYNATVAFPPPPMYGEDNAMWKGGISLDKKKYSREHYAKNADKKRDKMREYYPEYYAKNADKKSEYNREYYAKNRDKINEKKREHYAKNADKKRDKMREYREKKKAEKVNSVNLSQFVG